MKSLLAATLVLAGSCLPILLPAADSPAQAQEEAIEAKEAEVHRLREALKQQERELEDLRRENQTLRQEIDRTPPLPPAQPPASDRAPAPPAAPVLDGPPSALAPLVKPSPGDVIEAGALAASFARNPDAAPASFDDQTFLVRGEVVRLETALLQRRFWIEFRSAETSLRIRAQVVFPASWAAVFAARDGSRLVERGDQSNRTVLQSGDTVMIRARCQGRRGNEIRFDRGELLPPPNP